MAGSIFASVPGKVIRVPTSYASNYVSIRFDTPFDYRTLGCVIVEASIRQQGNFQILNSVSDLLNIDIFGDDVIAIRAKGYAFLQTCDSVPSGTDSFLDYYTYNKLSNRSTPIKIFFGSKIFQGFLTDSELTLAEPEIGLGSFTMNFASVSVMS